MIDACEFCGACSVEQDDEFEQVIAVEYSDDDRWYVFGQETRSPELVLAAFLCGTGETVGEA